MLAKISALKTFYLCLFISNWISGSVLGDDVTIVLICQDDFVSIAKCDRLEDQIKNFQDSSIRIFSSKKYFGHDGDWAILPIISELSKLIESSKWVVFMNEDTAVDVKQLLKVLSVYDAATDIFLGHTLYDQEPTIIHHFFPKVDFPYPLLSAGFALSFPLFQKLLKTVVNEGKIDNADFSIDASHELALYITEQVKGPLLTNSQRFCIVPASGCATWVNIQPPHVPVSKNSIFFAIKTCKQFHDDRVPVLQSTWGKRAYRIGFYSDTEDPTIPTTQLNVENTLHGHCVKTREIILTLKKEFKKDPQLHWGVITDDDTILSVRRVQDLLGSYNFTEMIGIGERYGYNLYNGGYNYITGGGGIILSRELILQFGRSTCICPSPNTPDDMFLFGICFKRMHWSLIHSPLFHQARPNDYSKEYLSIGKPVSFHKHWMIDPIKVYNEWFEESETELPEHDEF